MVGLSVPQSYLQENDDQHPIEVLEESLDEIFAEENQQPEDVRSCSSNFEQVDYEPEMIICDETAAVNKDKLKRKITEHSPQNGTSSRPIKLVKIDLNKTTPKNGIEIEQKPLIKGKSQIF